MKFNSSIHHNCDVCESQFIIHYNEDLCEDDPVYCPFCGNYITEGNEEIDEDE